MDWNPFKKDDTQPQVQEPAAPQEPQEPQEPAEPKYLTEEEAQKRIDEAIRRTAEETSLKIMQGMQSSQQVPQYQPPPPLEPIKDVSDDDLATAAAMASEDGGKEYKKLMAVRRKADEERMNRRFAALENSGASSLSALSQQTITTMPHYRRFEKEINSVMSGMAPAAKANPQSWKIAYDMVVGQHAEELASERAEAAMRQAQEDFQKNPPASTVQTPTQHKPAKVSEELPDAERFVSKLPYSHTLHQGDLDAFAARTARQMGLTVKDKDGNNKPVTTWKEYESLQGPDF